MAPLLIAGFVLRIVGMGHGLPYRYSFDERYHFVPKAIEFFGGDWNPDYFLNPPAFTYLLHFIIRGWFFVSGGSPEEFQADPTAVFLLSRATVAVLGALSIWLIFIVGRTLVNRYVGYVAAALMTFAFLPVSQAHYAVNDVPAMTAVCVALVGAAKVFRGGRLPDYLIAGAGVGLAAATKYTAGIVLMSLITAAGARFFSRSRDDRVPARLSLGVVVAVVAFVASNPFSVLDAQKFLDDFVLQTTGTIPKLGQPRTNGVVYYLWVLTWGFGALASAAIPFGTVRVWVTNKRLALFLLAPPIVYVLFMGTRARFFSRWALPLFPWICLLAAIGIVWIAATIARRNAGWLKPVLFFVTGALVLQGAIHSTHLVTILDNRDSRELAREWMVQRIPKGAKLAVEPILGGETTKITRSWKLYRTTGDIEDYVLSLRPGLIDDFIAAQVCWVVVGSSQFGRAFGEPLKAPGAIAYYHELERRGTLAYRVVPWAGVEDSLPFDFDLSSHYYDLSYERPGPEIRIYRLHEGKCNEQS